MADIVWPQDSGTGSGTDDYVDAGFVASLFKALVEPDYVAQGMEFTPTYATPSLDIGSGLAIVETDSVSTQDHGSGSETLTEGGVYGIWTDARNGISLTADQYNHVWYEITESSDDSVSATVVTSGDTAKPTEPSATSIYLGYVNTYSNSYTEKNRGKQWEPDSNDEYLETPRHFGFDTGRGQLVSLGGSVTNSGSSDGPLIRNLQGSGLTVNGDQLEVTAGSTTNAANISYDPSNTDPDNVDRPRPLATDSPTTVYVDPNGDDSGAGTDADPYASLERAFHDIPFIVMHRFEIRVKQGTNSNSFSNDMAPPVMLNHSKGEGVYIAADANDPSSVDPSNYVIEGPNWISGAPSNGSPGDWKYEGLQLNARLQNYGGAMSAENCILNSDPDPTFQSCVSGYAPIWLLRDCTFNTNGNADFVCSIPSGHCYIDSCSGDPNTAIMDTKSDGGTLHINDYSSTAPHLEATTYSQVVIEDGEQLHPPVNTSGLRTP